MRTLHVLANRKVVVWDGKQLSQLESALGNIADNAEPVSGKAYVVRNLGEQDGAGSMMRAV